MSSTGLGSIVCRTRSAQGAYAPSGVLGGRADGRPDDRASGSALRSSTGFRSLGNA